MRELNEHDVEMFTALNRLKFLSRCLDKQVVCLIVDDDYNILSLGINTLEACDQNCDDKENRLCVVRHAEQVAVDNLSQLGRQRARKAYVSLFPCAPCQHVLSPFVDEIVAFGMAHKKWESDKVVVFPHVTYKLLDANVYEDAGFGPAKEIWDDLREVRAHSADRKYYATLRDDRLAYHAAILGRYGARTTAKCKLDKELGL